MKKMTPYVFGALVSLGSGCNSETQIKEDPCRLEVIVSAEGDGVTMINFTDSPGCSYEFDLSYAQVIEDPVEVADTGNYELPGNAFTIDLNVDSGVKEMPWYRIF